MSLLQSYKTNQHKSKPSALAPMLLHNYHKIKHYNEKSAINKQFRDSKQDNAQQNSTFFEDTFLKINHL